jgi:hypothetical protein
VKTLPGDVEKIDKIQALIDRYVDVDRMLEKLAKPITMEPAPTPAAEPVEQGSRE